MEKKLYVVKEDYRTPHDESATGILEIFATREAAEALVAEKKAEIHDLWKDYIDETWNIDTDVPGCYEIYDENYDAYYEICIDERELTGGHVVVD